MTGRESMRPGRVTADLMSRSYGTFTESHPGPKLATNPGVHVMIGDPASAQILLPIFAGWRGCALSYLYALRPDVADNETILATARTILDRYRPDPERQPHLIMRIDDPRHAQHWRGWHAGTSSRYFQDALSSPESTAAALASQLLRTGARQLLLCQQPGAGHPAGTGGRGLCPYRAGLGAAVRRRTVRRRGRLARPRRFGCRHLM